MGNVSLSPSMQEHHQEALNCFLVLYGPSMCLHSFYVPDISNCWSNSSVSFSVLSSVALNEMISYCSIHCQFVAFFVFLLLSFSVSFLPLFFCLFLQGEGRGREREWFDPQKLGLKYECTFSMSKLIRVWCVLCAVCCVVLRFKEEHGLEVQTLQTHKIAHHK